MEVFCKVAYGSCCVYIDGLGLLMYTEIYHCLLLTHNFHHHSQSTPLIAFLLLYLWKMSEIEAYPPRYYEYLASQRRVSNWVQQAHSNPHSSMTSSSARVPRRPIEKHFQPSTKSMSALTSSSPPTRHRHFTHKFKSLKQPTRLASSSTEKAPVSPAAALITSSIFVYAFLPSLLTVMAFVVVLTLATMETEVCDLPFAQC